MKLLDYDAFIFWSALLGLTFNGWNAIAMVLFAEIGGVELAASVQSVGLTTVFLGFLAGPILFGYTADHFGYFNGWMLVMVFSFISTSGLCYLSYKRTDE